MLLSLSIWVPIVAGLVVLAAGGSVAAPGGGERHAPIQRSLALGGAIFGFLVTIPLFTGFDVQNPGMQFVQSIPWITRFNINSHLAGNAISVRFLRLNLFIKSLRVTAGRSAPGP